MLFSEWYQGVPTLLWFLLTLRFVYLEVKTWRQKEVCSVIAERKEHVTNPCALSFVRSMQLSTESLKRGHKKMYSNAWAVGDAFNLLGCFNFSKFSTTDLF